ncbi:RHS repeat protein, partial [Endozoicomonas sp. SM1973]|nr:RHS repeat protein [Spartinivicinus marinus]
MQFKQTLLAGALSLFISPLALSGASSTTSYQYDNQGNVTQIDGPRTDVQDITQFSYNDKGQLTEVVNALGHSTQLSNHNAFGNPQQITDANGTITSLSYDEMGQLTQSTIKSAAGDITTRFEYDAISQVTAVYLPNGSELHYEYDAAKRLTAIQNGLGERIEYQHDNAGNITKQVVKSSTGAVVSQFSQAYDEMSRLLKSVGANGQTSHFVYDKNSNTTGATNPRNYKSGNAYDALNRLVQNTDALNQSTQFKYDSQDNLTQVTDPRGVATTYQYDG